MGAFAQTASLSWLPRQWERWWGTCVFNLEALLEGPRDSHPQPFTAVRRALKQSVLLGLFQKECS